MSAPTPSLSHLSGRDYEMVYEPAEDSFLLMDALEKDAQFLSSRMKSTGPTFCLEIGSGSGAVITFLANLLPSPKFSWAVDINRHACLCSSWTLQKNSVTAYDVVAMDLATNFEDRLAGKIDILLFNPPYVLTPSEEVGGSTIAASWAGGKDGREVINRLLPSVAPLLSPSGIFYLLMLEENNPGQVCERLARDGLEAALVISRSAGNEKLHVYKFYSPHTNRIS